MKYKKCSKSVKPHKGKSRLINFRKYLLKFRQQKQKETLFRGLVKTISSPSQFVHFFIDALLVGTGFILNYFDEMPLFSIKGTFGFAIYLILSYTIKYMEKMNNTLSFELTGDPQLSKCREKYTKKINSNYNFLLCFFSCVYFVSISIILNFVKINPIGIYSLIALSYVVFGAFIVFQQYIFILFLLYDISKVRPGKFYDLIPERTKWFNLLEEYSNFGRNMFIILGTLFILLFIIFSPVNSIQIIFQEGFSSPQFIPLLCTWIIILIAIIFMIPFSSFIRSNYLHKIYKNLITQSIDSYNHMYKMSKNDSKLIYMDIILRLNDRKYVLQEAYAWVIPLLVSITNFASIIISIIVDLKDLNILT